ncbi:MAG: hypothetical protein VX683_07355 [Cyanobacteriota bacterium]|nr:hypothetical protein [Cyanobacteriota bacterium]
MVFSCACGADSVGDAGSAGEAGPTGLVPLFSAGDACFCQFLLTMLASGFDAGSAEVFCW